MQKRKNCDKPTSYNCGNSCINDSYVCTVGRIGDKASRTAAKMADLIMELDNKSAEYTTPLADTPKRRAHRQMLTDKYFGGNPERVTAFEAKMSRLLRRQTVKLAIDQDVVANKINTGDGFLKNQFETGTSGGVLNLDDRAFVEQAAFGYDSNGDKSNNPKYGYVYTDDARSVNSYGDTIYEAKDMPLDQYTITMGDSLLNKVYGSRAYDFKIESMAERIFEANPWYEQARKLDDFIIGGYIEAQIGGPVNFNKTFTRL